MSIKLTNQDRARYFLFGSAHGEMDYVFKYLSPDDAESLRAASKILFTEGKRILIRQFIEQSCLAFQRAGANRDQLIFNFFKDRRLTYLNASQFRQCIERMGITAEEFSHLLPDWNELIRNNCSPNNTTLALLQSLAINYLLLKQHEPFRQLIENNVRQAKEYDSELTDNAFAYRVLQNLLDARTTCDFRPKSHFPRPSVDDITCIGDYLNLPKPLTPLQTKIIIRLAKEFPEVKKINLVSREFCLNKATKKILNESGVTIVALTYGYRATQITIIALAIISALLSGISYFNWLYGDNLGIYMTCFLAFYSVAVSSISYFVTYGLLRLLLEVSAKRIFSKTLSADGPTLSHSLRTPPSM